MSEYDFHPEAVADVDEIWDYVAESIPDAAGMVAQQILATIIGGIAAPAYSSTD